VDISVVLSVAWSRLICAQLLASHR
jgi:hypothetical protein